jgi:uncharacterized protein (DUF58 family)
VENTSRRRTSALVAEEVIPRGLGSSPQFVLDEIEPGGHQELSYEIDPAVRGKFAVGPLRIRVADAFGLVRITRSLRLTCALIVTLRTVALPRVGASAGRARTGGTRPGANAIAGENDPGPRPYQDGDSLRRMHWKSTARYGELMVRREEHQEREQQTRTGASVFLDTRRCAHAGSGLSSTFEFAVSAAASISAHLTEGGFQPRLITEAGEVTSSSAPSGTLVHTLTVITASSDASLRAGASALATADGPLIAVSGRLSPDEAVSLAGARRGDAPAMALLLAVSTWASGGHCREAARAAAILSAAGWRVAVVTECTPSRLLGVNCMGSRSLSTCTWGRRKRCQIAR